MARWVKDLPAKQETQETWVPSRGREDPLQKEMATHSSILAWKSHGQKNLAGSSPWGCKELDTAKNIYRYKIPKERREKVNVQFKILLKPQ